MSTPLWDAASLRAATGGAAAEGLAVSGVSIDSRAVAPGDLFVALRDTRDGHDFVADALARGAGAAMVDRAPAGLSESAPLLRVGDTLAGLTALGAAGRARSPARFVAVTGSVGKTSTKEMLAAGLSAAGRVHAAAASYNNHWGVPLTLARMPVEAEFGVIEIGMNARGEIAPLSRLARPHVAIVTVIAPAHLGRLGSIEAIAEEKADIVEGLEPGGTVVLPAEGEQAARLQRRAATAGVRAVLFGEGEGAEARLLAWRGEADRQSFRVALGAEEIAVSLAVPGRHMAMNAVAALAAARALGVDPRRVAEGLAGFAALAGRGARVSIPLAGGAALLLDESYNANTTSMRAALAVLAAQEGTRRIAVMGDMLELGDQGAAMHAALAAEAAASADLVFTCGPQMAALHAALPAARRGAHAADSAALAPIVAEAIRAGDAVLVKGSLGSRMAAVVRAVKGLGEAGRGAAA
ncbi:UDP-N-acetylmuramoyl-tripeptide--D-alanyl-D-alanine ligase [Roseomonas nepalensis]|uniref:UDP-N-acetylmuramoyl-tripeptide--D-alanyl-D-alanine ligase n=1 Tax=Muricoccus nepalensis TaxID=1854500 RepID=A0A502FS65_9PROT|nr:UDP-N-acetylmuramoyl-tripeptide--D-alanyl-D-alanine ligase [Roseomonas nepalensis]TPG51863.1 UDP-N-acetylmuramoyl-tripeptide--D-alanyl-D-alanine ligase [Roseomonas nepalensis]